MSGEPKTLTPQRFRKKPVVVEAIQWTGANTGAVMEWTGERRNPETGRLELTFVPLAYPAPKLWVEANSAWVHVEPGEWFIRDERGVYPCKPEIFEATYEPVGVPVVARDEAAELREENHTLRTEADGWLKRVELLEAAIREWVEATSDAEMFELDQSNAYGTDHADAEDRVEAAAQALRRLAGGESEK